MVADRSEDDELRLSFREFLDVEAALADARGALESPTPFNRDVWGKMVGLGWPALPIPEAYGGIGLGVGQLALLYGELGRSLVPTPIVGTMLIADAIVAIGSDSLKAAVLPAIAEGSLIGSVSVVPGVESRLCRPHGGERRLEGRVSHLLDGAFAGLLLVLARDEEGELHVLLVPGDRPGVEITSRPIVDVTRHLADAVFVDVSVTDADILAQGEAAVRLQARLAEHGAMAVACDALGGAQVLFDRTVEFLKVRVQFDKPIGAFQALKHRAADHKVRLEAATALLELAVEQWQAGAADGPALVALAKAMSCEVYDALADDALQMHGGIGLTWEHDCHLFLKRAKLDNVMFGERAGLLDQACEGLSLAEVA